MARCDACGNEYERSFEVSLDGSRYVFDSFECAIERLAPRCAVCDVRIVGHGLEEQGAIYCCAHCARRAGAHEVRDNA